MLSTSCIENTRFIGTLVYIEIFWRTFSFTGLAARQAMMCGHDADFHQPLDAELGGLGFLLAERARLQHVSQRDRTRPSLRPSS